VEGSYAGALSVYIYLATALYSADAERWRAVRETLDERVVADLRASGAYWAQFEGPVDTVSNAVYDGFLKSYGTIGVKSYGACVDLNYFFTFRSILFTWRDGKARALPRRIKAASSTWLVAGENLDGFLKSYGTIGVKSYGACVDLLVAYFK